MPVRAGEGQIRECHGSRCKARQRSSQSIDGADRGGLESRGGISAGRERQRNRVDQLVSAVDRCGLDGSRITRLDDAGKICRSINSPGMSRPRKNLSQLRSLDSPRMPRPFETVVSPDGRHITCLKNRQRSRPRRSVLTPRYQLSRAYRR
ncbi:hypothetical protein, partial [Catenulispora pinisilvae]|uniref:hypothetical protein n=1 Tax=Catenulispora pinisilvae TaxID=2705253 RepID=UPI001E5DBBC3